MLLNLDSIPDDCVDASPLLTTLLVGRAGGAERLYVNIDKLQPGAKSCKYHKHSMQEEFFLVLRGQGTLRLDDMTYQVRPGSCFSKPAGRGIAHQFINTSDDVLEILDVGIPHLDDVIEYPDENVIYRKVEKLVYRHGEPVSDWTSDPNP